VIAHGHVQGVFFRDSVRREAVGRDVSGWASNEPDGTVEMVFEGDGDAVEAMISFVRGGPGHSSVASVDVVEEEPENLAGFDTR
jgi:acylphosphatase